jgi:periodic tryptophan protein 1
VHHDVALAAFPICCEWLQVNGGGSFAAVGTMEVGVELWDLDDLNAAGPALSLGGREKKKKKRKGHSLKEGSHSDAVMGLSWRAHSPTVLATGSADRAVKLWDLQAGRCAVTWTRRPAPLPRRASRDVHL